MSGVLCYCDPCYEDSEDKVCVLKLGGQCYSAVEEVCNPDTGICEAIRSSGCFSQGDQALLQCKGDLIPSYYGRSIKCCNYTDYCNKYLLPMYKHREPPPSWNSFLEHNVYFVIFLISITLGLIVIFLYLLLPRNKYKKQNLSDECLTEACNIKVSRSHSVRDNPSTSGSGAGKPLLIPVTIGRQFEPIDYLGGGQFTDVYLGVWKQRKIVEKIFSTHAEERWLNEKKIYETALLRHDNVLGYVGVDILDVFREDSLHYQLKRTALGVLMFNAGLRAIYTEYHEDGSLRDYLKKKTFLTSAEFVTLIQSAIAGIAHLHTEIAGTQRRPAVAHRDISSKNFLIRSCNSTPHKECVISNFEIAIMHMSPGDSLEEEPDITLGTPRYMAPEMIKGTIQSRSFEAFKRADIYSLGLVFYEISRRYNPPSAEVTEKLSLPFFNVYPVEPISVEDMQVLYVNRKPIDLLPIPPQWETEKGFLKPFLSIMRGCLHENPEARRTALNIKKAVEALAQNYSVFVDH